MLDTCQFYSDLEGEGKERGKSQVCDDNTNYEYITQTEYEEMRDEYDNYKREMAEGSKVKEDEYDNSY